MAAGLIQYWLGGKHLGQAGLYPSSTGDSQRSKAEAHIGITAGIVAVAILVGLALLNSSGVIDINPTIPDL